MPIEFRCPQCGRLLRAGDGTSGRRALCPGCGAFSTVPEPEAGRQGIPPAPEVAVERSEPPAPPPAAEPDSPFGPRPVDPEDAENPYLAPTQYGPTPAPYGGPVPQTDSRAVVSLVLGLCGVFLSCLWCPLLGTPVAAIGLMLGIMARKSASRGLAIAGIILCGIQLVLALVCLVVIVVLMIVGELQGPPGGW